MRRPSVIIASRKRLSAKQKAAIIARQNGLCAVCLAPLGANTEYDHEIALQLGGKDDESNIRAIHADPCHRLKTKRDVKLIAKGKRLRAKAAGTWRLNRKSIRSRGFDKTKSVKLRTREVVARDHAARMS